MSTMQKLLYVTMVMGLILLVACGEPVPTPEASQPAVVTQSAAVSTPTPDSPATPPPPPTQTPVPTSTPLPIATAVSTATPTATPIPPLASFSVDVKSGSAPLDVEFTNTSDGPVTSIEWDFGDGTVSDETLPTHRYTIAGTYTVGLTVTGPGGTDTKTADSFIEVNSGEAVSLDISPSSATLAVQESVQFVATAKDGFGNVVVGEFAWEIAGEGGSIEQDGTFTADTISGDFADTVTASFQSDSGGITGAASVTVEPGPIAKVVLAPHEAILNIGETQSFTFTASDDFDNKITNLLALWSVTPEVGEMDDGAVLTVGTKAGEYPGGIRLEVVKGTQRNSVSADVIISPDPLKTVEVSPSLVVIEKWETQIFTASGFDEHGNLIPSLAYLWETEGGEVTQDGLYTAAESGLFSVTASAVSDTSSKSGSAMADVPLVAYWPGDGNADDVAGGHHGILRRSATYGDGVEGQSFRFPRSGAVMEVLIRNEDFNYEPDEPMTIEFWAKRTYPEGPLPDNVGMHLLGKRVQDCSPQIHYQMPYGGDEVGFGSIPTDEVGGAAAFLPDILPYDEWRHISVTFDGFVFNMFIDSVMNQNPSFGSFANPNDASLVIGGSGGCETFIGFMDEVRIYNRALTAEEIKAQYEAGVEALAR